MVRATLAALVMMGTLTGAAYLYLPDSPKPMLRTSTPTTTASQHQPVPSPRPGNGRERYRGSGPQPAETFIPLGFLAVGLIWWRSLEES